MTNPDTDISPEVPDSEVRSPQSTFHNQTGPKTPEGKRRSSLNALKHGLHAKSSHAQKAIADWYYIDFQAIYDRVRGHYRPLDPMEEELVNRIARCMWRLARAEAMEARLMDRNPGAMRPGTSLEKLMKYERTVDLQLYRAIRALERRREARRF